MKFKAQRSLFCTTALIGFLVMPMYAQAEPQGGNVTAGNADIQQAGNTTTINQSSDRAIIRWDSFDLNSSESVQFNQPRASSITVNRIRDNKPSQINGRIGANGNIILLNPNGVVFGATSTVDVGGLVATTSDLEDDNAFMNGGAVKFTKPGNPDAKIINHGNITVKEGGLVGLVAPNVENHGIIEARLGKVALASGDIATIDFAGDGLIKLEVSDAVLSQSVLNTGTIKADGGSIILTAAQARGMVDTLVTNTGKLQANTVTVAGVERKGEITLSTKGLDLQLPRTEGMVFNTGTIEAQGIEDSQSGGYITVLADQINLGDGSYVTAAGGANGGSIKIGGEYQGGEGLPTSDRIFISEHVILNAESHRRGKGGTIILWSDTHTRFYGHADVSGGIEGGDGGFIEVSGKKTLDFAGTVDLSAFSGHRGLLLLDPTDIVISNSVDNNISGGSPYTPTVDNGSTVLNVTTLQNALASGNVIVQTRATGAQAGNITVSDAITWGSGNTLTLDAHNNIVVNAAISGNNLWFIAGNDVQLAAAVTGSGTLTFEQAADSGTVGIGASAVGSLNLNAADLANITNGWNEIVIGKSTSTAAMDVRATTWNDALTLKSGTGVITTNGVINMGANTLSIITDGDINLLNALTGTGTLNISQTTSSTGMALGNSQTGAVNLTATEIGRITNGWSAINLGRTDGTGAINMHTLTWNDNLTIMSGIGVITLNGTQSLGANNLTVMTDADIIMTGGFTGTAALSIYGSSAATTMGFGDGQSGTVNFTNLEVSRFTNGWASLSFGRTDGSGTINVGALTWNDNLTMQTGSGVININGNQALGANNLTYRTDSDINMVGNLGGTGNLTFVQSDAATSMGIGNAQAGTMAFTLADIAKITDGWTTITFGRSDGTANLEVGATTWTDALVLNTGSGVLRLNDALSMGANNLTLRTDSNIEINSDISGTGAFALVQSSVGTSMGLGFGEIGTINLDDVELDHILNGWSGITLGRVDGTGDLNLGSYSWSDALTLRTGPGLLNINGTQTMGGNALNISTDSDLSINANLTGSGNIVITGSNAATSIGLGDGQSGGLHLSDAELNRIMNGWGNIYIGATTQTGAMNIGARTWNDPLNLRTLSGLISINGAQSYGGNALAITTNSDIAINDTMTGTSTFTFTATTATTSMGIGTGQTGAINFSDEEIDRMSNNFSSITLGSTSQSGAVNIGTATTLKDPLIVRNTTGLMSINSDLNMGSNNLTLSTNSNISINSAIIGTGTLNITPTSTAVTMGVGTGQTGTVSLSDAELSQIASTWSNVAFGGTGLTVALNVAGRSWAHSVEYRTNTGAINLNGVQNVGANNLIIRTNSNLSLSQNLVGSGTLTFMPTSTATTMGIGDGQTGTYNLTNAELAYVIDGWSNILFGRTDSTGAMNIGARTWNDSVDFRTRTGVISINGAQNMGANNMIVRSDANPVINAALSGAGDLSFFTVAATTTIGIGGGMTGTFNFTDAELNNIADGWNLITFGTNAATGAMNIGSRTWNDSLLLNTSSGVITIAGQTMGANNLTIRTAANPAINGNLDGSGILTIQGNAASTTMGIGTSATGTVQLSDAELNRIINGWGGVVFGRTDATGAMNASAYTWSDNVTYQTGSGLLTVAGNIAMGANNLSLITNSNLVLNGNLSGTGNLTLKTAFGATTMGIGDSQPGGFNLTNAELARLIDGWSSITIGGQDIAGHMAIGTYTWLDPMVFITQGNITINGDQSTTEASGTSLVYATTNGNFINNAGSDAINPGGGRYLVYSVDENNDTLGGIVRPGILTNKTYSGYGPTSVVEAGSQHLYSGLVSKVLYLTIDDIEKFYGDALPAFTYSYVSGLVNGDFLGDIVLGSTFNAIGASVFDDAGITRTVTGSFSLGNGYTAVVTNGTMTVVKSILTVEADPASRVYGNANPSFTVSYTGFKNGEDETDINVLATASTTANALSNVGSYAIATSGASDNNYDFMYVDGALNVTKATLVATMQNTSRVYGNSNPSFTATYTGFKNGENASVIDTLASGTSAAATANVGSYAIVGTGALDNNYNFTYVNGTMNVTKATLLATANNTARFYGDSNPVFGITYTGFKNGENSSVIDTLATASSAANALSGVGAYGINVSGGADNNYNFAYADGALTVNKAVLTAAAGSVGREYGEANPTIGVTYSGFKNGETSSVIDTLATGSSAANAASNAGVYATTASGAFDNNYTFSYTNGALTVSKAMLLATANDDTRAYGYTNPSFTFTYTGFKNGEDSSVIDTGAVGSSAGLTANVGTYAIAGSGAFDNNYNFNYANGALIVTKANAVATANNVSRYQGAANPALGISYSGLRNGENASVIDVLATASTAATINSAIGPYVISASGALDNNYTFSYVDGILTVLEPVPVDPSPFSPVVTGMLRTTVSAALNDPVMQATPMWVSAQPSNASFPLGKIDKNEIVIIEGSGDYRYVWEQNNFLIAIDSAVKSYYNVTDTREENRQ